MPPRKDVILRIHKPHTSKPYSPSVLNVNDTSINKIRQYLDSIESIKREHNMDHHKEQTKQFINPVLTRFYHHKRPPTQQRLSQAGIYIQTDLAEIITQPTHCYTRPNRKKRKNTQQWSHSLSQAGKERSISRTSILPSNLLSEHKVNLLTTNTRNSRISIDPSDIHLTISRLQAVINKSPGSTLGRERRKSLLPYKTKRRSETQVFGDYTPWEGFYKHGMDD